MGNVDAGKSTLLGVLTHGELDNGRGFARQKLFRHKHEMESGRTSSVGNDILGFDQEGQVSFCHLLMSIMAGVKLGKISHIKIQGFDSFVGPFFSLCYSTVFLIHTPICQIKIFVLLLFVQVVNKPDSHGGGLDWTKICEKSSKVITFIDLAGHEKYLKTTVFGMTGHLPDFCMLMVRNQFFLSFPPDLNLFSYNYDSFDIFLGRQ